MIDNTDSMFDRLVLLVVVGVTCTKKPNALFPPFRCRSAVGGQPISVLVTSSLCIRKNVSSISVLTRNGNGSYGTEERQRYNGTAERNGETATAERQRNGGNQA